MTIELTYLGQHWPHGGDLFYMTHRDGRQARVYVDDLGETWVDIRVIPEGGWFYTERVEAYRALHSAETIAKRLAEDGFASYRESPYAGRVRQREI